MEKALEDSHSTQEDKDKPLLKEITHELVHVIGKLLIVSDFILEHYFGNTHIGVRSIPIWNLFDMSH